MTQMIHPGSACLVILLFAPTAIVVAQESSSSEEKAGSDAKPLSVAPLDHKVYPKTRPQWLVAMPQYDHFPHSEVVISGPCDSAEDSLTDLKLMQRVAVENYIRSLPGADVHIDFFPVTDEWIEENLIVKRYDGQLTKGGVTQYEHAVELNIDEDTHHSMMTALQNTEVRDRLGAMGVLIGFALAGLVCTSTFFGMLSRRVERRDQATAA